MATESPFTFLIQTSKGRGKYKTRYSFSRKINNSSGQPVLYFNSINVGNGYNKRLVVRDNKTGKMTTLARVMS